MKRITTLFLSAAFVTVATLTPGRGAAPELPKFPPLQLTPPKAERVVLDNGLVIFLLEDHELPLIKIQLVFQGGSQADPITKIGLGTLYGETMTYGGSESHEPEEIEKILNQKAATISFSIDLENGGGSMGCRRDDFDQIFALYQDLVLRPRFRNDKFEIAKAKAQEGLRRLNDDPDTVARREFRRVMYGPYHPYARIPSPAMIKNVKRQDLVDAHKRFLRPNGTWMAVSGDFKTAEMTAKMKQAFGSWTKSDVKWPEIPMPMTTNERRVFYIQRPINQSQIRIGGFGLERHHPDHFAWEVFNELWGGSAGSMLFRTVRTEKGLAYSVGSGYSEPAQKGLILAVSQTRGSQTLAAIQSIIELTRQAREAPFLDQQIEDAKEAIRNRFVENFTSSAQIVAYMMTLEFFGFPKDYLDTYTQRIAKISRADLQRVGKTYLQPEQFAILVMGDLSTFDKPMSTLGQPREIKLPNYDKEE